MFNNPLYLITSPPGPSNIYAPNLVFVPAKPQNTYLPPFKPTTTTPIPPNIYLPPDEPQNIYLPPVETSKRPPITTSTRRTTTTTTTRKTTTKPPTIYLPPDQPQNIYLPPFNQSTTTRKPSIITDIVPPKIPEESCGDSLSCCGSEAGRFVIPIPMKSKNANGCCLQTAKLILPVKGFDMASIEKLKSSIKEEIDATELIRNILENLLT
jgi:hypothetical protein